MLIVGSIALNKCARLFMEAAGVGQSLNRGAPAGPDYAGGGPGPTMRMDKHFVIGVQHLC